MQLEDRSAKEQTARARGRGLMLILSSPSGAGKTTLTRMLLQTRELDLTLSISVTTRARRSSEVDGIHYTFIAKKQFDALRESGDLLEWAKVHGNFYGTPREPAEQILRQGRDVLFDIDYQGTQQIKREAANMPSRSLSCRRRCRNCVRASTAAPRTGRTSSTSV